MRSGHAKVAGDDAMTVIEETSGWIYGALRKYGVVS
jgi:hypothetical protein